MGLFSETKVRDAMTERPRAVTATMSSREAAQAMATEDVGACPVLADGELVGIVTDRDIALQIVANGTDPDTPVGEILSTELVTVDPDDALERAMELMAHHQLRRLPVVRDGQLVGMIAQADIARMARDSETGSVVEAISEGTPRPRV